MGKSSEKLRKIKEKYNWLKKKEKNQSFKESKGKRKIINYQNQ